MEVAETHANWRISLKSTTWSDHFDPWGLKRVIFGKHKSAMIVATLVWTVSEAKDAEMPEKDVVWIWLGYKVVVVFSLQDRDTLHLKSFCAN